MADPGDAGDYAGDTTLALYCELLRTDKSAVRADAALPQTSMSPSPLPSSTLSCCCALLRHKIGSTFWPPQDVRRAIVASLPPCPAAAEAVLERVTDVDVGVRRAAFSWLAHKLPMTALRQAPPAHVDQRVRVLREGLADPTPAARDECAAMLESWCGHHCGGDVAL
eukprot:SM008870S23668  [mRNA]  locus=s8870:2:575:- [translate_table: standard]